MNIISRLARCAGRVWRFPASKSVDTDLARSKRRARVHLRGRLPAHLMKDIGVDDG
jgi:uncharacterized protein YjiS (DUF1127 family)